MISAKADLSKGAAELESCGNRRATAATISSVASVATTTSTESERPAIETANALLSGWTTASEAQRWTVCSNTRLGRRCNCWFYGCASRTWVRIGYWSSPLVT
jgi:hypothetical protein